jgi:hypothetical protein
VSLDGVRGIDRVGTVGGGPHGDVAVGDNADDLAVVRDHHVADVVLAHQSRGVDESL